MGRALQVTVVAKGVETAAQSDWLRDQGCVVQQGFLFSRPAPIEAAPTAQAAKPAAASA